MYTEQANQTIGASSLGKVARANSPIEEAQDRIAQRIEVGHELCSKLESRLESVLRPQMDPTPKTGQLEEAPASPLHSRLQSTGRNVDMLVNRLDALIDRLAV